MAVDGYNETYGDEDTEEAISDSLTGLFAGVAPHMDLLGMGIIALILLGIFVAVLVKLGDLSKIANRF